MESKIITILLNNQYQKQEKSIKNDHFSSSLSCNNDSTMGDMDMKRLISVYRL